MGSGDGSGRQSEISGSRRNAHLHVAAGFGDEIAGTKITCLPLLEGADAAVADAHPAAGGEREPGLLAGDEQRDTRGCIEGDAVDRGGATVAGIGADERDLEPLEDEPVEGPAVT